MSNDQNRNRNQHGNRNNDRNRGTKTFSKGEQMEVVFGLQNNRPVSCLEDGTLIFPKSLRFRPIPGKKYQCSVKFRENARGTFGLALPTLPMTLTPKEWVPVEELRSCLVVELVFEQKRGREGQDARLIAFHEGRAVFPDVGTTVVTGKRTACLLREAGNVAFAIPIGVEQSTGKGLMLLGERLGEVLEADLKHVVVKFASKKNGVIGMPKVDADLEISGEYRSIYEVLSDAEAKVMVTESSTEDEVNKAYRRKTLLLHPDRVAQDFGGGDKLPLPIKKNAEFFFEALGTAKERALDLISRKKGKSEKREAPKAQANQSEGNASAPKADGQKRDRGPRKDRNAQRQQMPVVKVETEAPKAEAAPVVTEEPKAEEAVSQNTVSTIPAPAETPVVEATPAPAPTKVDEEYAEIVEAAAVAGKSAQYAGITLEGFVALPEPIQKFYLKQARCNIRNAKAAAKSGNGKKAAEAKGGTGGSKDFREQLAALKPEK
ncbi:MAG TPA: hypothetical protein VL500_03440 [Candidatus Eisenbacteria bacterium]|nr:hypothetical protein [Candidatus Eisenbacteria bacterium]